MGAFAEVALVAVSGWETTVPALVAGSITCVGVSGEVEYILPLVSAWFLSIFTTHEIVLGGN